MNRIPAQFAESQDPPARKAGSLLWLLQSLLMTAAVLALTYLHS